MTADLDDRAVLADRQRTGCLYRIGFCACPSAPHQYDGCKARASEQVRESPVLARLREDVLQRDLALASAHEELGRLRGFVSSIADLGTGAGLSDDELGTLIRQAREVLG